MKKIITFLMVLALGLAATASAQGYSSFGPAIKPAATSMSEQDYYAVGLYSWALRNDPKLAAYLDALVKATVSVNGAAPDKYTTSDRCPVLMPFYNNGVAAHGTLINNFSSIYGYKFPQLVNDFRNINASMGRISANCRQGFSANDDSLLALHVRNMHLKLFNK